MTTTTPTHIDDVPRLRHEEATELAIETYERLVEVLAGLAPQQWDAATPCEGWTVHDIVGHVIGAARSMLSLRELARQFRHGMRNADAFDGQPLDAVNQLQVDEHAHLDHADKLAALADLGPRAARRRTNLPAVVRWLPVPNPEGGSIPAEAPHRLSVGYLNDTLYTRDTWLHRLDVAEATGVDPLLGSRADERLVADVVREWADRHGQPVRLVLEGPAGGTFVRGSGGEEVVASVRAFLFAVTHRERRQGLLDTYVLF